MIWLGTPSIRSGWRCRRSVYQIISFKKTTKEIKHRHKDFEGNTIEYVYVIHNSKVVRFDKTMVHDIEKMIEEERKKDCKHFYSQSFQEESRLEVISHY